MEHDGTIFWRWVHEITHKNLMEKHGKTWKTTNPSRPFRRFEETISFRISQALTIQQNLALSEIKDGTIFPTERGYRRTKSKITAETVAPFRSFQYLSVVAHAKRIFYDISQMLFVT